MKLKNFDEFWLLKHFRLLEPEEKEMILDKVAKLLPDPDSSINKKFKNS